MHGEEDEGTAKKDQRDRLLRPLPRLDWEFEPVQARRAAWCVLGGLVLAAGLGCLPMPGVLRIFFGMMGLCLVAFPLTLFGYRIVLDRDHLFAFVGEELYRRAGIVAGGYVFLWLCLEYFLMAARAEGFVSGLFFAAFAVLATLLVHPLLELEMRDAFFHYCMFSVPVILLRFLLGFGWLWQSGEWIRYSTAPPPPLLPGM